MKSKCGPFALVAAARLRCCCNLRKSKGRLRPTQKQMRGKQMGPFCLGFARLRCCCNLRKSKGRVRPTHKRGKQMVAQLLVGKGALARVVILTWARLGHVNFSNSFLLYKKYKLFTLLNKIH
jgi:hypothetical protein